MSEQTKTLWRNMRMALTHFAAAAIGFLAEFITGAH